MSEVDVGDVTDDDELTTLREEAEARAAVRWRSAANGSSLRPSWLVCPVSLEKMDD